jgi:hypothetical protein
MRILLLMTLLGSCASSGGRHAASGVSTETSAQVVEVNPGNLLVFVGRRLEVRQIRPPEGEIWFDKQFEGRYRVLAVIHGHYEAPEIEFTAFDHKTPDDFPFFAKNDVVLLYVSKYEGRFFHEKYIYDDVYPTRDGRWAGCGHPYRSPTDDFDLLPHAIELAAEVRSDVAGCETGLYAEELFELKKRNVLLARGLFQMRARNRSDHGLGDAAR